MTRDAGSRRARAPIREPTTIDFAAALLVPQGLTRDISVPEMIAVLVILILSLAIHEVAHAWVAWKRGDSTAKDLGRITLDPLPHIDLWWTIIVPTVLWVGSKGQFIFGGAKPVPVQFTNLKSPHRDMALVAIAGPFSNFLIAIFLALVLKVISGEMGIWERSHIGYSILDMGVQLNLVLAVFNLLPIPPLDGSRVMTWLLPESMRVSYMRLESIGLILILFLLWGPFGDHIGNLIIDSVRTMRGWVDAIVTLGGAW